MLFFTGDAIILRVGDAVEGFTVAVSPLAQGIAVGFHGEVKPALGVVVDAVFFQKINTALGKLQPILPDAVDPAEISIGPAAAALHPHAFVGGEYPARPVQTGVNTAVFMVPTVLHPEIGHIFQLRPDPLPFR